MRKTKKLLAMFVAVAMMFSLSITAFAAPAPATPACDICDICSDCGGVITDCDGVGPGTAGTCDNDDSDPLQECDCVADTSGESADTTGEFGGDGDTTYVDTKIYSVVLPTSAAWDFILDPQGLIGAFRANGETTDPLTNVGAADSLPAEGVTAAALATYAGKIIPGSTVPIFQNRSSYNVELGVSIRVTGDANIVAASADVSPVLGATPSPAEIAAAAANNVLLNVQLQENSVNTNVLTTPLTFAAATTPTEVALDNDGKTLSFILAGANYVFTYDATDGFDYERVPTSYGNGTALQLGGEVNRNANWEDFAKGTDEISVEAKFSLAETATAVPTTGSAANAYGFAGAAAVAEGVFTPAVLAKGFQTASQTIQTQNTWVDLPFGFDGLTISGVTNNGVVLSTTGSSHLYRFDYDNETMGFRFTNETQKVIVVTLSDSSTHTFTFTGI
jgi:hypothetical protein